MTGDGGGRGTLLEVLDIARAEGDADAVHRCRLLDAGLDSLLHRCHLQTDAARFSRRRQDLRMTLAEGAKTAAKCRVEAQRCYEKQQKQEAVDFECAAPPSVPA